MVSVWTMLVEASCDRSTYTNGEKRFDHPTRVARPYSQAGLIHDMIVSLLLGDFVV